jgi:hypothetical protein
LNSNYTTRLQKGGALLDDMRLLVRSLDQEIPSDERMQEVVLNNPLNKQTRTRAADIYRRTFSPRFLKGDPPEAWKIVRPLEDRDFSIGIIKPVYYWITARSESLIYDFVRDEILTRSKSLDKSVRITETVIWLKQNLSQQGQSWSDTVTLKVARGLLAAIRDFGILEGGAKKKLAPVYLPIESFAYLAFALHGLGHSGEGLVNHKDWQLFLLKPPMVEKLFLEAHQNRMLDYQAAGKIHRIEFFAHNLEEMADVIHRRPA